MQDHKDELANSVTRSLMVITFFVFPSIVGLWLIAPLIIQIVPNYAKWEPSLVPLGFLTINVLFASVTTQLTNMLMAIGKIRIVSKLIFMWMILTIIFVPGLGVIYGINGAAAGYAIVSSTSIIAIAIAKKHVNFSLANSVLKTGIATGIMASALFITRSVLTVNLYSVAGLIVLGGAVYLISAYLIIGPTLLNDAKKFAKVFVGK